MAYAFPISRDSFDAGFPPDVVDQIVLRGLSGSPFFSALARRTTSRASVAFISGDPSGFGWVNELGVIPEIDLNAETTIVAPVKLAGTILLSSESVDDSDFNLLDAVGSAVADAMGPVVDQGVLYGDGTLPDPVGVFAGLAHVTGPSLRAAAINAAAEIMGAGGKPDTLFVTSTAWGVEMSREGASGPYYSGSDMLIAGLKVVVVPSLHAGDAIVADASRCYGIVRSDFRIEVSRVSEQAWSRDGSELRIIGRIAAIVPVPAKSARALTVAP